MKYGPAPVAVRPVKRSMWLYDGSIPTLKRKERADMEAIIVVIAIVALVVIAGAIIKRKSSK